MRIKLTTLLEQVAPEVRVTVQRTRDRTRSVLQEALRAECRLAMQTPKELDEHRAGARVPVEIAPGCPSAFLEMEFDWETELIELLIPYRSSLMAVSSGAEELLNLCEILTKGPAYSVLEPVPTPEIRATSDFATKCLKILKDRDPIQRILLVESDVLGEYRYEIKPPHADRTFFDEGIGEVDDDTMINPAHIRLYWAVIGFFAKWTGWRVEDLTIVVLAHELAHAYTQLGSDIDGRRWPASIFSRTDTALKEGLAQYYTDRVLRRLRQRYGGARDVFYRLLEEQPQPYQTHKKWKDHTPESVRLAMLQMRRWRKTTLNEFTRFLSEAQNQLRE